MMGIETTRWDAADYLAGTDSIAAYLEAVFEEGDPALIVAALNDVARANLKQCRVIPAQAGISLP